MQSTVPKYDVLPMLHESSSEGEAQLMITLRTFVTRVIHVARMANCVMMQVHGH
jgi:hypothetical protein